MDPQFEKAVNAIVEGDLQILSQILRETPRIIRGRSERAHHATLLHYVAANGVEDERQKTPANAVDVARLLLTTGSEVDALADMYGSQCSTMSMLVSSGHPAKAGLQEALVETLLDAGAAIEGTGSDRWGTPLMTALAFGYGGAAATLAHCGANTKRLAAVAGLGRLAEAIHFLSSADSAERHAALALAAAHGHAEVVKLLLNAGEDPNRYNPPGMHGHSTPLHQAVCYGHEDVVRLLVERGARTDIEDTVYHGTPLGWARHEGQTQLEKYLI